MQRMVRCVQTRKSQNAPSMVLVISIHILADSPQTVSLVQASHYFRHTSKKTKPENRKKYFLGGPHLWSLARAAMPSKKPKSPKKPRSPKRGKKTSAGSDVGTSVEEGCTALTVCDVVLQAALEITSVDVAEVPANTVVFVLETQPIDGGGQRALVALGDPARGHAGGWVTSISPGGKFYLRNGECFVRPNPVLEPAVPSGEEHEEEVPFSA